MPKNHSQIKRRLVGLVLSGNEILDGEAFGLNWTTMCYWRKVASFVKLGANRYRVTDATMAWARAERKRAGECDTEERRERNRVANRLRARRRFLADPEGCREYQRKWRLANGGRRLAYFREYYQSHKEQIKQAKAARTTGTELVWQ